MAGEWIKMRADLLDDPTVDRLAEALGIDMLTAVGALFCFWAWADKYAVDGHVDGATSRLIDKVSHKPGFCEALVKVGWLEVVDGGIRIPRFDRHNGNSAKERSLKNQRQARWRDSKVDDKKDDSPSTQASTSPSTREEKRREEKIENKEGRRATRIPPDFDPKPEPEAESGIDRQKELANFRDYWSSKARDNTKLDWQATWRQWARKADRPAVNRFAKPDSSITVPGRATPDPELIRLEMESKNATPMPDHIREHIKRIKGQA